MKYCKLRHYGITQIIHDPGKHGQCPYKFKCTKKGNKKLRCKHLLNL